MIARPEKVEKDYQMELNDFAALRQPTTSKAILSVPCQELIWVRDHSGNEQQLEPIHFAGTSKEFDDEIEDGEIVERDDVVDLLQQSGIAIESSRRSNVFFEDRSATGSGSVPIYNTFNNTPKQETSEEVICLDSSFDTTKPEDDSVIFVGEEKLASARKQRTLKLSKPDCLNTPTVNNLMKLVSFPKKSTLRNSKNLNQFKTHQLKKTTQFKAKTKLFGKKGKKSSNQVIELDESSAEEHHGQNLRQQESSTGEPSTGDKIPETPSNKPKAKEKRIILIDGSNVAMQYNHVDRSKKTDMDFSAEGLKICIDHFESMGFQVKAVLPEWRVKRFKSSNHELMNELKNQGKLTLTPTKSYDDRVLLEGALRLDAAVVSNDFYRDLIQEKPEFREIVNTRLIRFNWLFKQLIIPEDPHGRLGPKLNDILYK